MDGATPIKMVPEDHLYGLLLEQIRANNAALDRAHASNVEVQKSLAVAQSELQNGTRAFGELRTTLASMDARLRRVEIEKVDRPTCAAAHAGGKDTTFRTIMALLAGTSLLVAIIALARTATAQVLPSSSNGGSPMDLDLFSALSPFLSAQALAVGAAAAILAYILFEVVLKGFVAAIANAAPARKRAIVAVLAAALGAVATLVAPDVPIWAGTIAGLVASIPIMAARGMGLAIRAGKGGGPGAAGTAVLAFLILGALPGCGGAQINLDPAAMDAGGACLTSASGAAMICAGPCFEAPDRKACAVKCVVSTLKTAAPTCADEFGGLLSPGFGEALERFVAAGFDVAEEADKAIKARKARKAAEAAANPGAGAAPGPDVPGAPAAPDASP